MFKLSRYLSVLNVIIHQLAGDGVAFYRILAVAQLRVAVHVPIVGAYLTAYKQVKLRRAIRIIEKWILRSELR